MNNGKNNNKIREIQDEAIKRDHDQEGAEKDQVVFKQKQEQEKDQQHKEQTSMTCMRNDVESVISSSSLSDSQYDNTDNRNNASGKVEQGQQKQQEQQQQNLDTTEKFNSNMNTNKKVQFPKHCLKNRKQWEWKSFATNTSTCSTCSTSSATTASNTINKIIYTSLIVLIHGVNGFASDCEFLGRALRLTVPSCTYIAAPTVNQGLSHDGIIAGAERYLTWIKTHLDKHPKTNRISLIGHSLGGLYARALAGLLTTSGLVPNRLTADTLVCLATPHLPPRQHDWLFGHTLGSFLITALIGQSGAELKMNDKNKILKAMATEDRWIHGLEAFERLVCYANIKHDVVINYSNAALTKHEKGYAKKIHELHAMQPKPHIFEHFIDPPGSRRRSCSSSICSMDSHSDCEDLNSDLGSPEFELLGVKAGMPDVAMGKRLGALGWKRYGILPSRGVLAHADMVVKFKKHSLKHGEAVVKHIAGLFADRNGVENK